MRLGNHERLFAQSLRRGPNGWRCYRCSRRLSHTPSVDAQRRRHFASSPSPTNTKNEGQDIAVLGGGLSGLANAYFISKADPNARITVYEASDRVGGWVNSKVIKGPNEEKAMVFERGPRTLRTGINGSISVKLIEELGLKDDCIFVPKYAASARNRYIYDGRRLLRVPMPGNGWFKMIEDMFASWHLVKPLGLGLIHEFSNERIPEPEHDESIGSFISRRFNKACADIASAGFHGIYAGDIDKLSVRSLLPSLPYLARRGPGVVKAQLLMRRTEGTKLLEKRQLALIRDMSTRTQDPLFGQRCNQSSVITLKNGLGSLTEALERNLSANPKIRIRKSSRITAIEHEGGSNDNISLSIFNAAQDGKSKQGRKTFHSVISTLPHHILRSIYPSNTQQGTIDTKLPSMPTVTVMVVNLYFARPFYINSAGAFGYLIPRSVPFSSNPENALGVVFDSFAAPQQDPSTGAKLTVMLGGHWWDGFKQLPTEEDGIEMARSVVHRHLGIQEEPILANATLQRDCIPQYTVGHHMRMRSFHERLVDDFKGRLKVAGSSYNGVGVNDCTIGAWSTGKAVKEKGWWQPWTGLEKYEGPELDLIHMNSSGVNLYTTSKEDQ